MAQAVKDANMVATLLLTSNADGETPLRAYAEPSAHEWIMQDGITGSDLSDDIASRDQNGETVLMCVSEDDGETPVAIYGDSVTHNTLVDST